MKIARMIELEDKSCNDDSISKHVDELDDVIVQEPIENDDKQTDTLKSPNGKIRTKDLSAGIETPAQSPKLGKGKSNMKREKADVSKTRKTMMAFKKRSIELVQKSDYRKEVLTSKDASGSDLGEYYFKRRVSHFVNMAFESNEIESSNLKFADVVRKVINDPIREDIHPFGRGHLYASAFDGERPKIHNEEGRYFMWFLATLFIVGIAGSVIIMSITYQPEVTNFDIAEQTPLTTLNTST